MTIVREKRWLKWETWSNRSTRSLQPLEGSKHVRGAANIGPVALWRRERWESWDGSTFLSTKTRAVSAAQWDSSWLVINHWNNHWNIPKITVLGHSWFIRKSSGNAKDALCNAVKVPMLRRNLNAISRNISRNGPHRNVRQWQAAVDWCMPDESSVLLQGWSNDLAKQIEKNGFVNSPKSCGLRPKKTYPLVI
jgi:hypothetical protein